MNIYQKIRCALFPQKEEGSFFSTDENGRDLYFPYGKPGPSYYIPANQKDKLKKIVYSVMFTLAVLMPLTGLLNDPELSYRAYLFTASQILYGPVLIWIYFRLSRYTLTLKPAPYVARKFPFFCQILGILFIVQIATLYGFIYPHQFAPAFTTINIIWNSIYACLIAYVFFRFAAPWWRAKRNKKRRDH